MNSAQDQFDFVDQFNWDDGLHPIASLVDSGTCAFEAALLAFWRCEGPWIYVGDIQTDPETRAFVDRLGAGITSGTFLKGGLDYDPIAGEQLTKVQVHQLEAKGLPTAFFGGAKP